LSKKEEKEIDKLKETLRNNLTDFVPEYRDTVRELIENNGFIVEKSDTKYLKCDKTKSGFSSMIVMYYPCVFLTNSKNLTSKNKSCMIYPHRFSFCKNTTEESFGCNSL
jgi:Fe-S-cluster containining protein